MVRGFLSVECMVNWQQIVFDSRDFCPGTAAGSVHRQKESSIVP